MKREIFTSDIDIELVNLLKARYTLIISKVENGWFCLEYYD